MKKPRCDLSAERLRELLQYDPETGVFKRRTAPDRNVRVGDVAGGFMGRYMAIHLDGDRYYSHRLAWLYVYGQWPTELIDHINGDKTDNRIANLRQATQSENLRNRGRQRNNASGYRGVSRNRGRWLAVCYLKGRRVELGSFNDPKEASAAYESFAKEAFGEFYRPADSQVEAS